MGVVGDFLFWNFLKYLLKSQLIGNTAFILRTQLGETTKAIFRLVRICISGISNL